MIRILCATTIVIAALAFGERPAHASEAPWCAVINTTEDSVYWDCQYRSFEQCYPNILAGNRGFCNPNPAYQGVDRPQRRRPAHRHRTRQ
jgi:hypothetical protein